MSEGPSEEDRVAAAALIPIALRLVQEARFLNRNSDKPAADAITSLCTATAMLVAFSIDEGEAQAEPSFAQVDKTIRTMTGVFASKPRMHS
jgi:hypothetical protein